MPAAAVEKHLSEVKFSEEKRHFKIKTEPQERKFHPFSRNTTRRCLTFKKYSQGNGTLYRTSHN